MSKYPKRGPVIMPVEPPYEVLRAMAGNPVILPASDWRQAHACYMRLRLALAERKRK